MAQMKGVLLSLCRTMPMIVDISHSVPPQDVFAGGMILRDVCRFFPPQTLHVAVVDPGVGTVRRIIYAEYGEQRFIAPDNGLLSLLPHDLPLQRLVVLENRQFWRTVVSSTFHGRDIMAPVAAELFNGVDPTTLGSGSDSLQVQLPWPAIERIANTIRGEVVYVDSFGNLITNITLAELPPTYTKMVVEIRGRRICGIRETYGSAEPGEIISLGDSGGRLEIAVVNGNAAESLQVCREEPVVVWL